MFIYLFLKGYRKKLSFFTHRPVFFFTHRPVFFSHTDQSFFHTPTSLFFTHRPVFFYLLTCQWFDKTLNSSWKLRLLGNEIIFKIKRVYWANFYDEIRFKWKSWFNRIFCQNYAQDGRPCSKLKKNQWNDCSLPSVLFNCSCLRYKI